MAKKVSESQAHLIEGFILICLGLVIILNNAGVLPGSLFDAISSYWPWLLVIWGLKTIVKVK